MSTIAAPLFIWVPSYGAQAAKKPRLRDMSYESLARHRKPDGINMRPLIFSVSFSDRRVAEIKAIDEFFRVLQGTIPFRWTAPSPFNDKERLWKCIDWKISYTGDVASSLAATFRESFNPLRNSYTLYDMAVVNLTDPCPCAAVLKMSLTFTYAGSPGINPFSATIGRGAGNCFYTGSGPNHSKSYLLSWQPQIQTWQATLYNFMTQSADVIEFHPNSPGTCGDPEGDYGLITIS